jgi:hypothetical protein
MRFREKKFQGDQKLLRLIVTVPVTGWEVTRYLAGRNACLSQPLLGEHDSLFPLSRDSSHPLAQVHLKSGCRLPRFFDATGATSPGIADICSVQRA